MSRYLPRVKRAYDTIEEAEKAGSYDAKSLADTLTYIDAASDNPTRTPSQEESLVANLAWCHAVSSWIL